MAYEGNLIVLYGGGDEIIEILLRPLSEPSKPTMYEKALVRLSEERIELLAACERYLRQVELGGPKLVEQLKNSTTYNMIKDAVIKAHGGEYPVFELKLPEGVDLELFPEPPLTSNPADITAEPIDPSVLRGADSRKEVFVKDLQRAIAYHKKLKKEGSPDGKEEDKERKAIAHIKEVATGEIHQYPTTVPEDEGELNCYRWTEGNWSCDCNRETFFKNHEDIPEDQQCGDGVRYLVNLEVDGKIIYREYEDGKEEGPNQ